MKLTSDFHPGLTLRTRGAILTFPHTLSSRAQTQLCESSKDEDILCLIEDTAIEAYGGVEVEFHAFLTSAKIVFPSSRHLFQTRT